MMRCISSYSTGRTNIPIAVSFLYERELMYQMNAYLSEYDEEKEKWLRTRRAISERNPRHLAPTHKKKKHSPSMTMKNLHSLQNQ